MMLETMPTRIASTMYRTTRIQTPASSRGPAVPVGDTGVPYAALMVLQAGGVTVTL